MATSYDAVFIGAGHNTLAAALHLSVRGWSVGVFEQGAVAGGAVKTGDYTVAGFRHDWAAMNLSLFAGSTFFETHGPELMQHGLEFVPVSNSFATVFPDHTWCGVSTDLAATTARIATHCAADAATWNRLMADFPNEAPHLFGLLDSPMKMRALAFWTIKFLRAKGLGGTLDMGQFLLQSPRQWLTQTFESPHVQAMLGAWGLHLDFAPDITGGAIFPYIQAMASQAHGMVLGKGGADTIIRAMVATIETHGGSVETDAAVTRILHANGKAHGIELADGRTITATRAVIAGVAPRALPLLTGTSSAFDAKMTAYTYAPGTMMIHLALRDLPDWNAGHEVQSFAYVHIAPSLDQMARTYQQAVAGLLPDEPIVVVGQPTTVDPTRAPAGQHAIWLQVRMAPGTITGDAGGEITSTDWAQAGEPFASRVLDIFESHAPGTRAKILGQRVVTPLELEQDNPNLVGGDQVCGSHHMSQHYLFRPARGHADGSTPIKNLHLTGAAVWPGAGTGAGSGFLLARSLVGK
ncbi:MAG: NAD(P)/FAD-dependent oxidoreductase [Thermoleophilia bacterium]